MVVVNGEIRYKEVKMNFILEPLGFGDIIKDMVCEGEMVCKGVICNKKLICEGTYTVID